MDCASQVDALEQRLSGVVAGPTQEALDAHLGGCADCRAYLEVAARAEQQLALREAAPLVPRQAAPLVTVSPATGVLVQRQLDRLRLGERSSAGLSLAVAVVALAWGALPWPAVAFALGLAGHARWQRRRWERDPDPVGLYRRALAAQGRALRFKRNLLKAMLGGSAVVFAGAAVTGLPGPALLGSFGIGAWVALLFLFQRREDRAHAREVAALAAAEENRQGP